MNKRREKKVSYFIRLAHLKNPDNPASVLYSEEEKHSSILTIVSIVGPMVISALYSFYPPLVNNSFLSKHMLCDVAATVVFIVALMYYLIQINIIHTSIREFESTKAYGRQQINELKVKVDTLQKEISFYGGVLHHVADSTKKETLDIKDLVNHIFASIYVNLMAYSQGDYITLGLYELRNDTVKLISYNKRLVHCNNKTDIDNPILFMATDGLNINDESIRDYYCIKCMRGVIRGKDNKYVLPNWESIVRAFEWKKWEKGIKDQVLEKHDLELCRNAGFEYNQYIGLKIPINNDIIAYLEIIANKDTFVASEEKIDYFARGLQEKYAPIISALFGITKRQI